MVLLGDRYGWEPLPANVEATEFEALLAAVDDATERELLERWYRRDANAVPPEFVLLPREGEFEDAARWGQVKARLRETLRQAVEAAFPEVSDPLRAKFFHSATHQEIPEGVLQPEDAGEHVFAWFRDRAADEVNPPDPKLETLKAEIAAKLPETQVRAFAGSEPGIDALCRQVEADLRALMDREIERFEVRSLAERERAAHLDFARKNAELFVGREAELAQIADYQRDSDKRPLVVSGVAGSGKTALLAKAACAGGDTRTIVRHVGATPRSAGLRTLLEDLFDEGREPGSEPVTLPAEDEDLAACFAEVFTQPAVVFVNALGSIERTGGPRSGLVSGALAGGATARRFGLGSPE